ncbi:MAG: hypothetical protein HIU92_20250 [Proteobacteria bacterium]|nr:hypothetical protein [Pseudomonadota bacterium]
METLSSLLTLLTLFLWLSGSFVGIALAFVGMIILSGGEPGGYIWAIIAVALLPRALPLPLTALATIGMWITVAAAVGYGSWLAADHWLGTHGAFFAVFMLALIASSIWSEYKNPTQPKPRAARPQATPKTTARGAVSSSTCGAPHRRGRGRLISKVALSKTTGAQAPPSPAGFFVLGFGPSPHQGCRVTASISAPELPTDQKDPVTQFSDRKERR